MAKQLPKRDLENVGLGVTGACVALVTLVVAALIFMVAQEGLSAFLKDGVSVVEFFTGTKWDLANTAKNGLPYTGALPLIVTSFAVMVLSTLIALPIAIGMGAGAEARRPLGLAVVGGLCFSQLVTLYITPVYYAYMEDFSRWLTRRFGQRFEANRAARAEHEKEEGSHAG